LGSKSASCKRKAKCRDTWPRLFVGRTRNCLPSRAFFLFRPTQFFFKEYTYALIDGRSTKGFTPSRRRGPQSHSLIRNPGGAKRRVWHQCGYFGRAEVLWDKLEACQRKGKLLLLEENAACRTTRSITECVPTAAVRTFILPSGKAWLKGAFCICGEYARISAETATIDSTYVPRHRMKWTAKHKQALHEGMHKRFQSTASLSLETLAAG